MKNTNPIRVLQILGSMDLGGAETMVMNYYRTIDRTKVQFDFLLHRQSKGAYDDEILELGGRIHYVPSINPKHYKHYLKSLKDFFSQYPEYKIVHSHLNSLSVFALKAAKKNSPIRIAHSHIAITPINILSFFKKNQSFTNNIKDLIHLLLRKSLKKSASHFFACGAMAADWMYGTNPEKKVYVLNNAINIEKFSFDKNVGLETKEKLGVSNNFTIGHVGRFHDQKNHVYIIKIFIEILKYKKNAKLVLVGTGSLQEKIKQDVKALGIEDKVSFLGSRTDIPEILQAFDIFLFPSLFEGLPVTLIEAQAAGLKIFSSDKVSSEVLITDLVEFIPLEKSPYEWASIINEKSTYSRINQKRAMHKYDIISNAQKLEKFYISEYNKTL